MKTKFVCCDLTENLAAFEHHKVVLTSVSGLQDLPKIIACNQFVKPINLTRFFLKVALMNGGNKNRRSFSETSWESYFKS